MGSSVQECALLVELFDSSMVGGDDVVLLGSAIVTGPQLRDLTRRLTATEVDLTAQQLMKMRSRSALGVVGSGQRTIAPPVSVVAVASLQLLRPDDPSSGEASIRDDHSFARLLPLLELLSFIFIRSHTSHPSLLTSIHASCSMTSSTIRVSNALDRVVSRAFEAAYSAAPETVLLDVCAVEELIQSDLLDNWYVLIPRLALLFLFLDTYSSCSSSAAQ